MAFIELYECNTFAEEDIDQGDHLNNEKNGKIRKYMYHVLFKFILIYFSNTFEKHLEQRTPH